MSKIKLKVESIYQTGFGKNINTNDKSDKSGALQKAQILKRQQEERSRLNARLQSRRNSRGKSNSRNSSRNNNSRNSSRNNSSRNSSNSSNSSRNNSKGRSSKSKLKYKLITNFYDGEEGGPIYQMKNNNPKLNFNRSRENVNFTTFHKRIAMHIRKGWKPQGGIGCMGGYLFQAMVKK